MTDYPAHIDVRAHEIECEENDFHKAVCRALMETVPEPVDPDLLLAREAAAQVSESRGCGTDAKAARSGEDDGCYPIEVALRALKMRPIQAPVSEERIEEMAREVAYGMFPGGVIPQTLDLARAGIKRGLAERGEVK